VEQRSPSDVSLSAGSEPVENGASVTPSWARTGAKWLLVCGLSAIPSFLFGAAITKGQYEGMLLGILVFVAGYTWLDRRTATRRWRRDPRTQRTLRIGYGTRIAISVLFPIGSFLDVLLGAIAVEFYQVASGDNIESPSFGLFDTFLTTLIQGSLLNVVLMVYMLVVHAVQISLAWILDRRSSGSRESAEIHGKNNRG
jgi:uncharacterized membrane protein YfcA